MEAEATSGELSPRSFQFPQVGPETAEARFMIGLGGPKVFIFLISSFAF